MKLVYADVSVIGKFINMYMYVHFAHAQ
jgi:hypothetical protein